MEMEITGKNVEISPEIQSHVQEKIGKLGRHLPGITDAKVEITEESTKSRQHRYVVQVTLNCDGILLRGEERGGDIYSTVTNVKQVLDRQIERYKGRQNSKGRRASLIRGEPSSLIGQEENLSNIVKVKRFKVKPMLVEEAVEQMELLGHDFFLFFNSDSDQLNLLYRRKDGDYGLIKPI